MSSWNTLARAYATSFATLCDGTHEVMLDAALGPTEETHDDARAARPTLLDVGCGDGRLAAKASSRGALVMAVDPEADMVALAAEHAPGRVVQAVLPDLPWANGAFDAVTANFVVNHLPDPRAGVRELARVTRPGGLVTLTVWPPRASTWSALVGEVFTDAGVVPLGRGGLPAHLDFDREPQGLASMCEEAGLAPLDAREITWVWRVSPDDLWTGLQAGIGVAGETLQAQRPDVRAKAHELFVQQARESADSDGVLHFSTRASFVLGTPAC